MISTLACTELVVEPPPWGYDLCVVGTFLTKFPVNFLTLQQSLSDIWQPRRGMEITKLEGAIIF
ncbi:hypothetical protein LINGRAHAP2_LOCUS35343 [Linum grandiflorum]